MDVKNRACKEHYREKISGPRQVVQSYWVTEYAEKSIKFKRMGNIQGSIQRWVIFGLSSMMQDLTLI